MITMSQGMTNQTLCLVLITDMMALSSPSRLNSSSLQTLSDQVMFKTSFQSHIPQFSSLRTSSFFKVHNSAPYRRVLKSEDRLCMMTSRAHCMLVFVVKERTKWRLVVEAGSLVVFQAALRTVKETRICRFMFSQRKRV